MYKGNVYGYNIIRGKGYLNCSVSSCNISPSKWHEKAPSGN
jgi:hypothetical protein